MGDDVLIVGCVCACGSEDIYFHPCPEHEWVVAIFCFGCGDIDRKICPECQP